ncbi:hypothetical protein AB1Y20_004100 [Prymnesium parvum]|uniref:Uncharacterized protein n=1 Tax=Prymnesium parvum TaxID=97485 RepID=A0AB34J8Y0_PRYPA
MGWLTVSCPANTQGQLTFADVEDAISILLMDLTDESREGGAIEGVPTNPSLVDDSIQSGPWFFGFENQWVAMQIAAAADGKLIVDTADSSLVCNFSNQMKVVITKCKWPSSMPGKPQRRNKFIVKAAA